jgi:hypothetical protein
MRLSMHPFHARRDTRSSMNDHPFVRLYCRRHRPSLRHGVTRLTPGHSVPHNTRNLMLIQSDY